MSALGDDIQSSGGSSNLSRSLVLMVPVRLSGDQGCELAVADEAKPVHIEHFTIGGFAAKMIVSRMPDL